MSRKSSIQYNPKLTVKENALLNNVSESGIYYYIRNHSVNREEDRANNLIDKITHAIKNNPEASQFKISKITGLHLATVKKYWNYAKSGQELIFECKNRPYRKPSSRELEIFFTTDKTVPSDLLRVENFGKDILDPFCSAGVLAEVLQSNGYIVHATDIQDRGYGAIADFHRTEWETGKYDIVTIPPINYNLISAIAKCVEVANNKVALLLPIDVICGEEQYNQLFKDFPPSKIYAYIETICFYRNSKEKVTNKNGYGWFVWTKKTTSGTVLTWIHNEQLNKITPAKNEGIIHEDDNIKGIIGAVCGDIIGSTHEGNKPKVKTKDRFNLFTAESCFTDDTVMTIAIADAILKKIPFEQAMREWAKTYPKAGYGKRFKRWLKKKPNMRTDSFGNGSAMRVSAAGYSAKSIEEALKLAEETAKTSHNSEDGINAAQCTAVAVYMANNGYSKTDIIKYIKKHFNYKIYKTEEEVIRFAKKTRKEDQELARVAIPIAMSAFSLGDSFESVVRLAVYFGVDTDTIGAIACSIAGAYFGIPRSIADKAVQYLPIDILEVVNRFDNNKLVSRRITPHSLRTNGTQSVVVYGINENNTDWEDGRDFTIGDRFHHNKLKSIPIKTIGTSDETLKNDIRNLITHVEENPNNLYYIFDIGLSEKSNRGIELMAQLLEPLRDKDNVYLWQDFWDYYNSCQK